MVKDGVIRLHAQPAVRTVNEGAPEGEP